MKLWLVYILVSCCNSRTYVGITLDAERRLSQHNGKRRGGAKATRGWRPWKIGRIYGPFEHKGRALQIEAEIKKLRCKRRLLFELNT